MWEMERNENLSLDEVVPDFRGVRHLEDIQRRFFSSAHEIISRHELAIRERSLDITALELYLKLHEQPDIWFDRATDGGENSREQLNRATWYVSQRKGPAYWRVDITAGDRTCRIQAGLLIRQVDRMGGPATAFQKIVRGQFGRQSWTDEELALVGQIHGKRIDGSDGSPLTLRPRKRALPCILAKGKRINLPPNEDQIAGQLIRDAALRVAIWRKYSNDMRIAEDACLLPRS